MLARNLIYLSIGIKDSVKQGRMDGVPGEQLVAEIAENLDFILEVIFSSLQSPKIK